MRTAHELFVHELNDILDAEHRILESLQQLEQESHRADLRKAFSQHRSQTEKQIERLEQCFEELDEEPQETECRGIMGLVEEKQAFMQEEPSTELIELFNLGAAGKVEHYEIATYTTLIDMAQKMGHKKTLRFLQQNLKEEEQMLKKCEGFIRKFTPSRMGMEEEAKAEEPRHRKAA
jgi:ferritin-like metal-binding protein YciE